MNSFNNVAFGAGKSGAVFDPVTYATKPQVILRVICWISAVIVWACISFNAWNKQNRKETCLFNGDNSACRLGSGVAFIGFLASTAFLAFEAFYQNISSIKVRRRAVLADIGFSGVWAAFFLVVFLFLAIAWGKSDYPPLGKGINNCRTAIVFAFFSIGSWAACAYFAYLRWQEGADMTQFSSGFEPNAFNQTGQDASYGYNNTDTTAYAAYTAANETDSNYNSNPFTAVEEQAIGVNYQAPSY